VLAALPAEKVPPGRIECGKRIHGRVGLQL